jgi:topoisomerase-4 subunit A
MVEVEPGAVLTQFFAGPADTRLIVGTQKGLGFITTLDAMQTRQRAGKQFMTVEAGDSPSLIRRINPDAKDVALLTAKGRLLVLALEEIKVLPTGGRGVSLIEPDLKADGFIDALSLAPRAGLVLRGQGRTGKPTEEALDSRALKPYVGKRARKGQPLAVRFKPDQLTPAP